jgi:hypothetical protein
MKSRGLRSRIVSPGAIALALALSAGLAHAEEGPLPWLNATRAAAGWAALDADPYLMETAGDFASLLAGWGRISHTGPDGSDPLTRYLRMGGTSARVGEILGAGENLSRIEAAWLSSPGHKEEIVKTFWTHAGWGMSSAGNQQVWVILFVQKRTAGLSVEEDGEGGLRIGGSFIPSDVVTPILVSGIDRITAWAWDPGKRSFVFLLPAGLRTGYIRLGYTTESGALVIADVITSPRGRESPGEGSRF